MQKEGLPVKTSDINVKDRVILVLSKDNDYDKGVVQYIGKIGKGSTIFYGIELDEAKGKHDGKGLFKTETNHATIVKLKNLRKIVSEDFDQKLFKKKILYEVKQMKKAKDAKAKKEQAKNSGLDQIKEENMEASTVSTAKVGKEAPKVISSIKPVPKEAVKVVTGITATNSGNEGASQAEVTELKNKLTSMEKSYKEILQKKEAEILKLSSKCRSIETKKNEEIKQITKKVAAGDNSGHLGGEIKKMEKKMETMGIDLESSKAELEKCKEVLEEKEMIIEELQLDKELMLAEAEAAAEDEEDATPEDIKRNYSLVKMAFVKLEEDFETAKITWDIQKTKLEQRAGGSAMDNETVKRTMAEKQQQIEDLLLRLEECADSTNYIEDLTEKLLNKDQQVTELQVSVNEFRKKQELNEEIIEELEDFSNLLNEEMEERDTEIAQLTEMVQLLEDQGKEDTGTIQKYREKLRNVEGEIEIIKSEAQGTDEQEKTSKIDQLIKNYTTCFQSRRALLKELILNKTIQTRQTKLQRKWAIVTNAFPSALLNNLQVEYIEKWLGLGELGEKVDLLLEQFIVNFFNNSIIIKDNYQLLAFAVDMSAALSRTRDICMYLFDFAFQQKTMTDFKSLFRSNIFPMLRSIELLVERLMTEVREDTLSIKFNYSLMVENLDKIEKGLTEVTNQFELVPNKKAIDIQSAATMVYIYYLGIYDKLESDDQKDDDCHAASKKLEGVKMNASFNQNWIKSQARTLGLEGVEESGFDLDIVNLALSKATGAWAEAKAEGAENLVILKSLNTDLETVMSTYSKKLRPDPNMEEYLYQIITKAGPWVSSVTELRTRLEQFETLQKETILLNDQVEELKKNLKQREQELDNAGKIRKALEVRTQDLELRCQNIPLLEKEKSRLAEKERHFADACKRLEKENVALKEKISSGQFSIKAGSTNLETGGPNKPLKTAKLFQSAARKLRSVRMKKSQSSMKQKDYTFIEKHEVNCLQKYLQKMNQQVVTLKKQKLAEKFHKMQVAMPGFQQYLNRTKHHDHRQMFRKEAASAIGKVQAYSTALQSNYCSTTLVDCTPQLEESSVSRVKRLTSNIQRHEQLSKSCLFKASQELESFKSKWAMEHLSEMDHMSMSANVRQTIQDANQLLVGKVSFQKGEGAAVGKAVESKKKVVFDRSKFSFAQAVGL